jgi:hypothetical protein
MDNKEFFKRQEQLKKDRIKAVKEVQRRNRGRDYVGEALNRVNHPEKYYKD